MEIKDLTEEQLNIIIKKRPYWIADNCPEWMAYNYTDWMADNRPYWMAYNYPEWMADNRPDWMASHRPDNRPDNGSEVPADILELIE